MNAGCPFAVMGNGQILRAVHRHGDFFFLRCIYNPTHSLRYGIKKAARFLIQLDHARFQPDLKGELTEIVECSKHGGFKKDGTMMLICSDNSADTGLPESGNQYIFLAYAQSDGSLTLSEFFDNRQYSDELLQEYLDYCNNEVTFDRTRFISNFDKSKVND